MGLGSAIMVKIVIAFLVMYFLGDYVPKAICNSLFFIGILIFLLYIVAFGGSGGSGDFSFMNMGGARK